MKLNRTEFIKLFNLLKDYQETENAIYDASKSVINLAEIDSISNLFMFCVDLLADEDEIYTNAIYELLIDETVKLPNGPSVDNIEEFYAIVYGGEKE